MNDGANAKRDCLCPPLDRAYPEQHRASARIALRAFAAEPGRHPRKIPILVRWRRPVIIVAVALGTSGLGAGIAAAVGAFTPSTGYGPAQQLLTPTRSVAGAITRFVGRGPDGAVFRVVSASSHPSSGCVAVWVTDRSSTATLNRELGGGCMAAGTVGKPAAGTARSTTKNYPIAVVPWRSPSKQVYTVWIGRAPAGTSLVVSTTPSSNGAAGSAVTPQARWFAAAVPSGGCLTFYGVADRPLGGQGCPSHPPATK